MTLYLHQTNKPRQSYSQIGKNAGNERKWYLPARRSRLIVGRGPSRGGASDRRRSTRPWTLDPQYSNLLSISSFPAPLRLCVKSAPFSSRAGHKNQEKKFSHDRARGPVSWKKCPRDRARPQVQEKKFSHDRARVQVSWKKCSRDRARPQVQEKMTPHDRARVLVQEDCVLARSRESSGLLELPTAYILKIRNLHH